VMSLFALLSLGWAVRDGINVLQRRRQALA
jgi:hypothetical protein